MLVNLLTGVFDPPPTGLSIPWLSIAVFVIVAASAPQPAAGIARCKRPRRGRAWRSCAKADDVSRSA